MYALVADGGDEVDGESGSWWWVGRNPVGYAGAALEMLERRGEDEVGARLIHSELPNGGLTHSGLLKGGLTYSELSNGELANSGLLKGGLTHSELSNDELANSGLNNNGLP
ncbi:hypothetical protein Tco_0499710 [Tanacetum coccineum]